jgi:hypothetical protein
MKWVEAKGGIIEIIVIQTKPKLLIVTEVPNSLLDETDFMTNVILFTL